MPLVISSFFFEWIIVIKFALKKAKNSPSINSNRVLSPQIYHFFTQNIKDICVYEIFLLTLRADNNINHEANAKRCIHYLSP